MIIIYSLCHIQCPHNGAIWNTFNREIRLVLLNVQKQKWQYKGQVIIVLEDLQRVNLGSDDSSCIMTSIWRLCIKARQQNICWDMKGNIALLLNYVSLHKVLSFNYVLNYFICSLITLHILCHILSMSCIL